MQNRLSFYLSPEDIANARGNGFESGLLCLLARHTGTLWILDGPGAALEIMAPHRGAHFLLEVDGVWQPYRGGDIAASAVRADVGPVETPNPALSGLEIPQDGIAHLAMRFFEKRTGEAFAPTTPS